MKRFVMTTLAFAAPYLAVFGASAEFPMTSNSEADSSQNLRIVSVYQLTEQELNEAIQGQHPEMVVEFSAKTSLPIHFFLTGDLLHLLGNDGQFGSLEIQQTFYVRYAQEEFLFSTNLTDWKCFSEFTTGSASVSLNIQDGQPSIAIGAEADLCP